MPSFLCCLLSFRFVPFTLLCCAALLYCCTVKYICHSYDWKYDDKRSAIYTTRLPEATT